MSHPKKIESIEPLQDWESRDDVATQSEAVYQWWLRELEFRDDELQERRLEAITKIIEPQTSGPPISEVDIAVAQQIMEAILAHHQTILDASQLKSATSKRPIYDWFVGSLNVSPLTDLMIEMLNRLVRRRRRQRRKRSTSHSAKDPAASAIENASNCCRQRPRELKI
ncbi:hypothetical protein [Roseiconus lacunae]|uniref:hypothetical protein n=1 Tax=Roseiconus lacunae TaxID=2605694 RepID=UPI001E2D0798|nr:hypothetical protein [Roseiconus lacunae]MCD0457899.1 hypothetical protein [Roseiconus lacunae]